MSEATHTGKKPTEFNDDEFVFAYPDGIENNYWNEARNKIILDVVRSVDTGNILDVGAGRGIVTGYLHRHGVSIRGVELGITSPISNSDTPVMYNTDALKLDPASVNYKTITLFDVIEHIEEPVPFLKKLLNHFTSVENVIVTIPARKELWTNFDDYYGHFRRYDLNMVQSEMNEAGLEVVHNRYFFHFLYWVIRLNNLFSKKRAIQFNVPGGITLMIHKLIAFICYLDYRLLPGSMAGSSIICVARRKRA